MPSVLVELGFLTNAEEERLLRSQSYQERIARALATAIADFVRRYEQIHALSGAVR
jgi:N-acetylmuramoyl-L-alanine amidase